MTPTVADMAESPDVAEAGAPVAAGPAAPSWIGVWAFVLALLGLGPLLVVGSALGIVLGRVAIRRSAVAPVRGGRGLATAAFAIGLTTLALLVLLTSAYALVIAFGSA